MTRLLRFSALLTASTALTACINGFGAQCVTDPITGTIRCSGEYHPKAPPAPAPPIIVPAPERG